MTKLALVRIGGADQRKFQELSRLNPADLALAQLFDKCWRRTNVAHVELSTACGVARNKLPNLGRSERGRGVRTNHGALRRFSVRRKAGGGIYSNYRFRAQRSGIARGFVDVFNHG